MPDLQLQTSPAVQVLPLNGRHENECVQVT